MRDDQADDKEKEKGKDETPWYSVAQTVAAPYNQEQCPFGPSTNTRRIVCTRIVFKRIDTRIDWIRDTSARSWKSSLALVEPVRE